MPANLFLRPRHGLSGLALLSCLLGAAAPSAFAADAAGPQQALREFAGTPAPTEPVVYGEREDVMRFAQQVADRHLFDVRWVRNLLAQSRYMPSVARLIMPPAAGTAKNWSAYRARFVEPRRIRAGAQFWRANEAWLQRAEQAYGVPPEIIVGIIGVETIYGLDMGSFRVLDALATLSFDFPSGRSDRSEFFRSELEQLFVLAHAEGMDATALRGSYAGAIGMAQFMPSSWNRYAVDFDKDGQADLRGNPADVIGSVANYLSQFGWQPGMPTHFSVVPPSDEAGLAILRAPDILPSFTAQEFSDRGALLDLPGQHFGGLLALVELENGTARRSYIAGTPNFYAITRYNWSSYYALAVIELGRAVRDALGQKP